MHSKPNRSATEHSFARAFGRTTQESLHATRHPPPVTRYPSPATRHPLPVTRYPSPASRHPLPATCHPLPVTHYPLPVTCYPSPATRYPLPVTRYPSPVEKCCRFSAVLHLEEYANLSSEGPEKTDVVKETARYLQACHHSFEKGILSHVFVRSNESAVFKNIQQGRRYFEEWAE